MREDGHIPSKLQLFQNITKLKSSFIVYQIKRNQKLSLGIVLLELFTSCCPRALLTNCVILSKFVYQRKFIICYILYQHSRKN